MATDGPVGGGGNDGNPPGAPVPLHTRAATMAEIQGYCADCERPTNTLPCPHCAADHRFVRLQCPICGDFSPTCDRQTDVHRAGPGAWWAAHQKVHLPAPIWGNVPAGRDEVVERLEKAVAAAGEQGV